MVTYQEYINPTTGTAYSYSSITEFIDEANDVKVYLDGIATIAFTQDLNNHTITLSAVNGEGLLRIKRETAISPIVTFTTGSQLESANLNLSQKQVRLLALEAEDNAADPWIISQKGTKAAPVSTDTLLLLDNSVNPPMLKEALLPVVVAGGDGITASSTETLTNKTIDSSLNTLTNIVNADIAANAAIAKSKLDNTLVDTTALALKENANVNIQAHVTDVTTNPHAVTASQAGAEPAFTKNTGFNKALGTTAGTVSEGSHTHTHTSLTAKNAEANVQHLTAAEKATALSLSPSNTATLTNKTYDAANTTNTLTGVGASEIAGSDLVSGQTQKLAPTGNDFLLSQNIDGSYAKTPASVFTAGGGGGGEANTALNVGVAGVGVFKQKAGLELQFKSINSSDPRIAITDDTSNSEVDISLVGFLADPVILARSGDRGAVSDAAAHTIDLGQVNHMDLFDEDAALVNAPTQAAIDAEATARSTADTTLQTNIDAEATARSTADSRTDNPHQVIASQIKLDVDPLDNALTHTVQEMQNLGHSAGVASAANIDSICAYTVGTPTVMVAAFKAYLRGAGNSTAPLKLYNIAASTLTTSVGVSEYILLELLAGVATLTLNANDIGNGYDKITLGLAQNHSTVAQPVTGEVHEVMNFPDRFNDHARIMNKRNWDIKGVVHEFGSAIGWNAATLEITISAGAYWAKNTRYVCGSFDTAPASITTPKTFTLYHQLNGAWVESLNQTVLPVNVWNQTTESPTPALAGAEALVPYTAAWYGSFIIYQGISDGDIRIVYGNNEQKKLKDIEDTVKAGRNKLPTQLPPQINPITYKRLGFLTFIAGGLTFTSAKSTFDTTFGTSSVTNHEDLAGVQGGAVGDYQHLTTTEKSRALVFAVTLGAGAADDVIDFGTLV